MQVGGVGEGNAEKAEGGYTGGLPGRLGVGREGREGWEYAHAGWWRGRWKGALRRWLGRWWIDSKRLGSTPRGLALFSS